MGMLAWMLDADPAIRWQALRDLTRAPADVVAAERARVAAEGWGALLLSLQGEDGQWAGGAYFPARTGSPAEATGDVAATADGEAAEGDSEGAEDDGEEAEDGSQPWTATTYSLLLLRDFGVDPADERVRDAIAAVRDNCRWEEGDQPYFAGEVEPCINGMTIALGAYFGQDVDGVVTRLLGEQLQDGGWNCWAAYGSVRSSFATTINVLEGLLAYEQATGGSPACRAARRRGEEYLLERRLFRRKSNGDLVDPAWLRFSYPTRWHYDVLRALEYFRTTGDPADERLDEAVHLVRTKQRPDGSWLLENTHPGEVHFPLEAGDGRPSRWNTLRAQRVLNWYGQSES